MNVEDAGTAYVVTAELPGVKREDIDVELNEGRLSVSVEKKETEEEKGKNYLYKESGEWSATRGVFLKKRRLSGPGPTGSGPFFVRRVVRSWRPRGAALLAFPPRCAALPPLCFSPCGFGQQL